MSRDCCVVAGTTSSPLLLLLSFLILSCSNNGIVRCVHSLSLKVPPPKSPTPQTFVISHAAGRMGKVLASQVREGLSLFDGENPPTPKNVKIRALVRSEEEAQSLLCDLAGMVTRGGVSTYNNKVVDDWLEVVVIGDIEDGTNLRKMERAFEGATAAVLCDASHNELVQGAGGDGKWSLRIPAKENQDLSTRLLYEIAAAQKSTTLEHLVLRSSMGLSLMKHMNDVSDEDEEASDAFQAMGGDEALLGLQRAEQALQRANSNNSNKKKLDYTILRLGALTDNGIMPLTFGKDDSILLKQIQGQNTRRPPMISRADAARVAATVVIERQFFQGKSMVIDCAWGYKWQALSSAGSEEAMQAAGRQDLIASIFESCTMSEEMIFPVSS